MTQQQNNTTIETTTSTDIEVMTTKHDVGFNLHRKGVGEDLGLSIDYALTRAAFEDGTQLLIGAIPLWQYEDEDGGIRADETAENAFLAELTFDEARKLRAFLNHPEVSRVLDGPRMAFGGQ